MLQKTCKRLCSSNLIFHTLSLRHTVHSCAAPKSLMQRTILSRAAAFSTCQTKYAKKKKQEEPIEEEEEEEEIIEEENVCEL